MLPVVLLTLALPGVCLAGDWLTFGHDPQRSGWAFEETTLSPANVSGLKLIWKSKLNNDSYSLFALTAPVVADGVSTSRGVRNALYVAGITGKVFALDAQTGEALWTHVFKSVALPYKGGLQGSIYCPNGITATPVIDRSTRILYVIAGDGALYGFDLGTGQVRYGPVQFVPPYSKNWSLNLLDGTIHTVLAQGCGGGLSGFYSIDIRDPHHPRLRQMLLSNTNTAGIWGRGGPIIGTNGRVYGGTADGIFDPIAGDYSDSVVAASLPDLKLVDYYLPPNWRYLRMKDLDLGSASPVFFGWRNRKLVAHGGKEGVLSIMDADALGGKDHQTPLYTSPKLGNDIDTCCEAYGIWGGNSTARDAEGQTWLYVPMGGPPSTRAPKFPISNGDHPHGSIMAFKVVAQPKTQNPVLEPAWISGDFALPEPVVIANGVVFVLSSGENAVQKDGEEKRLANPNHAVLKALDATTGKELYNSGKAMASWVHFSGIAIANGKIFAVDHDSNVYCFGLAAE
jgi:outer membrane protein assembly factor BamB